jgi:2-octaprenyl-3-methyl-6-methoxy-1,4-benzoquinol hydroxylase
MRIFDVAVVGGSVAGSTAAYLLGTSGKDVAVIEPCNFPRYKACGEGLSSLGISLLQRAGLWSSYLEENSLPFCGYELHLNGGGSVRFQSGNGEKIEGRGVQRLLLDNELQLRSASVSTRISARATRFRKVSRSWEIETEAGTVLSRELVIAWGSTPRVKYPVHEADSNLRQSRYGFIVWLEGEWTRKSDGLIHAFQDDGLQFLTTPVSTTILNVSVLIDKRHNRIRSKQELCESSEQFAERIGFRTDRIIHTSGAAAVHSSRGLGCVPGAYCIGDALERFDPIGGMGMTHALSSATYISQVLNAKLGKEVEWAVANLNYLNSYKRQAWYYRNLTRLNFVAAVSANPSLIRALGKYPRVGSAILGVGKAMSYRNCMELVGGA